MAQSWPLGSQIAVEKKKNSSDVTDFINQEMVKTEKSEYLENRT